MLQQQFVDYFDVILMTSRTEKTQYKVDVAYGTEMERLKKIFSNY